MRLSETLALALKNIASSKMRTFLTMLGIIIGVTAVTVIVGLGNGMSKYMTDSFASLGTGNLTVSITGRGSSRSISTDQMYEMVERNSTYLSMISPTVSIRSTVKVGSSTLSSSVTGISEDYFEMQDNQIRMGRGIEYADIKNRKNVCVVGSFVNMTYYSGNAVGDFIHIGGKKFTIIGVMEQKADEMEEGGTDDCVYMPYSTAARINGSTTISSYTISVTDEDLISQAKTVIEDELYKVFQDTSTYNVNSMAEMLDTINSTINVVISILTVIAGISLLVGGVGIMNIMLVSVTERTREIGIRKALGAKERTILQQFVIEAAVTSGLGGVIGIAGGYALCRVASVLASSMLDADLTVVPTSSAVMMAFGISVAIGILFGYLPARKAARLNPIDALRYD